MSESTTPDPVPDYVRLARNAIDRVFGIGYAAKNPRLVSAVIAAYAKAGVK